MNDYQREQHRALIQAMQYLDGLSATRREALHGEIEAYIEFRDQVEQFLSTHCGQICSLSCYGSKTSACCSKDGIITFWADVLINACCSVKDQLAALLACIQHPRHHHKCIYLADHGCRWQLRPLVCTMFLCERVQKEVLAQDTAAHNQWKSLQARAKSFRWPDRPVLFDHLEQRCMAAGIHSPLMYLNTSPGLLRVKQKAGLIK